MCLDDCNELRSKMQILSVYCKVETELCMASIRCYLHQFHNSKREGVLQRF